MPLLRKGTEQGKHQVVMKQDWKPGTMIYPLPAVLVSCGSTEDEYNILTVAWTGTICTNPPMCYISVRPERHSYDIIKRNMEFVINLTTEDMAFATDWCGVRSGKVTTSSKRCTSHREKQKRSAHLSSRNHRFALNVG